MRDYLERNGFRVYINDARHDLDRIPKDFFPPGHDLEAALRSILDLNGFVRWILRCQAKREAGTLEP
jgi:hypothetical protein